jgi:acetyl esterase/lipase
MKKTILYYLAAIAIVLVSCKKDDPTTQADDGEALIMQDQKYGSDPQQKFDIFLPANRATGSTHVIFLIHGGGWRSGDKTDLSYIIDKYQELFPDYAMVTINYRLYAAGNNKFPVQEQDVKACIEYVMIHRADYDVSTKFAIIGFNEGAQLGLLYAYKYGSSSYMPKVVADWNGQTDLISLYNQSSSQVVKGWISDVAGNVATADSLTYISSSPLHYVSSASPPTLIIQGLTDTVTYFSQAQMLSTRLQQTGIAYTYKDYTGEGHTFSPVAADDARAQIKTFINTHLQ